MPARLAQGAQRHAVEGRIGQPKGDGKADFWTAVGGQYKASLDYVVHLACESGTVHERGPEVRTTTIGVRRLEGASGSPVMLEMHRMGGVVLDAEGAPAGGAWVALPGLGRMTAAGADGRWDLSRVPPGEHEVVARGDDGTEAEATVTVPGPVPELTLAPRRRARAKRS
jgi:hypothetical protein